MVTYPIVLGPEFDTIPDDTEETLVGSFIHMDAIDGAYDGLRISAQRRGLPWFVGTQIYLLLLQEGRVLPRQVAPDVVVYPTLAVEKPNSIAVGTHGPPALVIEVASPSTAADHDINLRDPAGKPRLYERIGVDEYLVFDPTEDILGTSIWALKRGPEGFVPWEPEADGRWHSNLGVSFAPQGARLRVYDHAGHLVPLSVELDELLTESNRVLAAERRRNAALEAEIRRLRGEEG
jgi:Uma2 family endonuclease